MALLTLNHLVEYVLALFVHKHTYKDDSLKYFEGGLHAAIIVVIKQRNV